MASSGEAVVERKRKAAAPVVARRRRGPTPIEGGIVRTQLGIRPADVAFLAALGARWGLGLSATLRRLIQTSQERGIQW